MEGIRTYNAHKGSRNAMPCRIRHPQKNIPLRLFKPVEVPRYNIPRLVEQRALRQEPLPLFCGGQDGPLDALGVPNAVQNLFVFL
jgi:hypothetical protein